MLVAGVQMRVSRALNHSFRLLTLVLLTSCGKTASTVATEPTAHPANQTPTATEVFHLRSECAQLGEKILRQNTVGNALTQSQVSSYNPRTNRCHVELVVQTADLTKAHEYLSRTLYDGQTGEMLSFSRVDRGTKSAVVFGKSEVSRFEDVNSYIDVMMKDE